MSIERVERFSKRNCQFRFAFVLHSLCSYKICSLVLESVLRSDLKGITVDR